MSKKRKETEREERRKQVAANVKAGLNYREIAAALNVSLGTVSNDMKVILRRWRKESVSLANDHITLELKRLDHAINAIWDDVLKGNRRAVEVMLKIQERRAKYLPLEVPRKIAPTDPTGEHEYTELTDTERMERISAIFEEARDRRDRQNST